MSEDGPRPGGEQPVLAPMLDIEILRHSEAWNASNISDPMVELAARAALGVAPPLKDGLYEMTIVLTGDAEISDLNRKWRGKDQPTNVLSFPAGDVPYDAETADANTVHGGCMPLGDIVIAFETTEAEAAEKAILLSDHLSHLVVHGALHLLGLDHQGDTDAEQMEDLERQALASLSISDPYAAPDDPASDGKAGLVEIL